MMLMETHYPDIIVSHFSTSQSLQFFSILVTALLQMQQNTLLALDPLG